MNRPPGPQNRWSNRARRTRGGDQARLDLEAARAELAAIRARAPGDLRRARARAHRRRLALTPGSDRFDALNDPLCRVARGNFTPRRSQVGSETGAPV